MRHDRDTALDRCLALLRSGLDVESCLERYPEYAEELRPLLALAVEVNRVVLPVVPEAARAAGKRRMMAAQANRSEREAQAHPFIRFVRQLRWAFLPGRPGRLRPGWHVAVATLLVLLIGISGVTVATSAGSLPGDALYQVKMASQRLQVMMTLNPIKRGLLADRYDTQRRLDVQAVLKEGRRATVEFQGVLQRIEPGLWLVSGLPVSLQDTTTIVGLSHLGAPVHVRGELPGDGRLIAHWVRIGLEVTPRATPTPEPTRTLPPATAPAPAATPTPTRTPEPTQALEETGVPAAGDTQIRTATPETRTPEPTDTPELEETPESTGTPEPPETRDDEDVPSTVEAPEQADAPEPAGPPEQEVTPEPTRPTEAAETSEHRETPEEEDEPEEEETSVDDGRPAEEETPVDDDTAAEGETPVPSETPDD